MKFDFRSFIRGGEILDQALNGQAGRAFTRVVPVNDAVLTPHETGDLVGAWAMAMCLRDTLIKVESTFPGFTYRDRLIAKGQAKEFTYKSPLDDLQWWQDKLPFLIQLEKKVVAREFVGIAIEWPKAMALIGAIEWFINRYRCRAPGVGEGLYSIALQIETQIQAQNTDKNQTVLQGVGIDSLSPGDRKAVEAMRAFDDDEFAFLAEIGLGESPASEEPAGSPPSGEGDPTAEKGSGTASEAPADGPIEPKVFRPMDDLDIDAGGFVSVARATAPDGFRKEDREAIDRFRKYVGLAVPAVQPLRSRWIEGTYVDTGQKAFAMAQLLFSSSFPNAESAKLREEEMHARRAQLEREAEEAQKGNRGPSTDF